MDEFPYFSVQHGLLIIWAVLCGGSDCLRLRLPNILTFGGIAAALAMLVTQGHGWLNASWASSMSAALLATLLTFPGYAFGLLGAGDVKMLFAVGLLGGMQALLITYAFAGLAIGLATMIWIYFHHWQAWFAHHLALVGIRPIYIPEPKGRRIPFGLGLAIGFVLAVSLRHGTYFTF